MEHVIPRRLVLDSEAEKVIRTMLCEHFRPDYLERVENYVETLLSLDECIDRFLYLQKANTAPADGYLKELMRVVKPGGCVFLEFPARYHSRELHTGLPSFEWLPRVLRDRILRIIFAKQSPLAPDIKSRYQSIVNTRLQQVNFGMIKTVLRRGGYHFEVVDKLMPSPGVVWCILKKHS